MSRTDNRYLKGPIAWPWLTIAARLPGRALHLAVALSFTAGVRKTDTVALPTQRLAEMGADRFAAYRALKQLESAGLVEVKRQARGRKTLVRLIGYEGRPTARRVRHVESEGEAA